MKKIIIFIILAMIWSACSTEPPEDSSDVPVFFIGLKAEMDTSTSTYLTAGMGTTYLFTRVDRGSDNVLLMSGAFADASCPAGDCPGSVRFDFRNIDSENTAEAGFIFQEGAEWKYRPDASLDSLQRHSVAIKWVKPDGAVFRSDLIQQPQSDSSYFHILKSEPWELNERGERTWKMNIDFSCWMVDSSQGQQRKFIGSGVIAVGYR